MIAYEIVSAPDTNGEHSIETREESVELISQKLCSILTSLKNIDDKIQQDIKVN